MALKYFRELATWWQGLRNITRWLWPENSFSGLATSWLWPPAGRVTAQLNDRSRRGLPVGSLSLVELHILDVSHLFEQRYPVQSLARKYIAGLMTG